MAAAFVCPTCRDDAGTPIKLEVLSTKHPVTNVTKRYRACPKCRRKLTTIERPAPTRTPATVGGPPIAATGATGFTT